VVESSKMRFEVSPGGVKKSVKVKFLQVWPGHHSHVLTGEHVQHLSEGVLKIGGWTHVLRHETGGKEDLANPRRRVRMITLI